MSNENKTADPTLRDNVISRRRVMKVALATAPIIATLPTGAALARSSNFVNATSAGGALDAKGRTLCLNANSGSMTWNGWRMDLGAWPNGSATAITQRDYRVDDKESAAKVSEGAMCNQGGTFYYKQAATFGSQHDQHPGWNQVHVPRGMLCSATALSSFAGSIHFTEV
jgi:hypothetical protein